MAHTAVQEAFPNSKESPAPLRLVSNENEPKPEGIHGPSEHEEQTIFLGRQAVNLAVAVGVAATEAIKEREVTRFLVNADYDDSTPEHAVESQEFVSGIIESIDGLVKTETAAALRAQNETLRQQILDFKKALQTQPAEVMLALAPYLKLPKQVDIDIEEFVTEVQSSLEASGEIKVPTTAELEAQYQQEADSTHSPARGIANLGHLALDAVKKTWSYILPPLPEDIHAPEREAELTR